MAKGDEGEIVGWNEKESTVREEVNRRTARLGLSTRYGESTRGTKIMTTVGFGKQKLNVWPRDKHGHLIGD